MKMRSDGLTRTTNGATIHTHGYSERRRKTAKITKDFIKTLSEGSDERKGGDKMIFLSAVGVGFIAAVGYTLLLRAARQKATQAEMLVMFMIPFVIYLFVAIISRVAV